MTIGIVSLLGFHQAALIEKLLLKKVGEEAILKHNIVSGDAATFQGKERNIIFVSMVAAQNDFRRVSSKPYQQRFNVAFSRAKDRMYLVRSLSLEDLDPMDLKAKAIMHFQNPMRGTGSNDGRIEPVANPISNGKSTTVFWRRNISSRPKSPSALSELIWS